MRKRHRLLERQIQRFLADLSSQSQMQSFFDAVSEAYHDFDADRAMLERSMEVSSRELLATNREVRTQNNELQSIYRTALQIHGDEPIDAIFSKLVSEIAAASGFPMAWIELYDPEQKNCTLKALVGSPELEAKYLDSRYSVAEVPHMLAFQRGDESFVSLKLKEREDRCKLCRDMNVESLVSVPLRSNRFGWLGALTVGDLQSGNGSASIVKYLQTVAGQISAGYERQQLSELNKRQEAAVFSASKMSELGKMAGGIAHEINTPLNIIMLLVDDLTDKAVETKMDAFIQPLDNIMSTVIRIASIVKGLRAFSRNGSGDPFMLVDMNTIVQDTVALCRARCQHSEVELRVNCPDGLKFKCRQTQISQTLLNLLTNSLDAVIPLSERWIAVDAGLRGEHVYLSVTDSGRGIPAEIQDKMTLPFFTTKEVGSGTGLGLSISTSIVKDHGGRLELDRDCPNTRFVVTLPLDPEANRTTEA